MIVADFDANGQRDRGGLIVESFSENSIVVVGAILDFARTDFAVLGLIPQLCFSLLATLYDTFNPRRFGFR